MRITHASAKTYKLVKHRKIIILRAKLIFYCIIMVLVRSHLKDTLKWSTANSCRLCVRGRYTTCSKTTLNAIIAFIQLNNQPKWNFIFRFVPPCNRLFVKHSCCNIQLYMHGSLSLYSFTCATFCSAGAVQHCFVMFV